MWQRCWLGVVLVLGGTALPAHGQVTLAWKWKPGDKVYLESSSQSKMTIKLMGQALPPQETTTTNLDSYTVLKDGTEVVLERTLESMKTQAGAGAPGAGPGVEAAEKMAKQLQGSKLILKIDPRQHKITKLEGVESLVRKATSDDPLLKLMVGSLNEANLRQESETMLLDYLPDKPVRPGDTWKRKSQFSLGPFGDFNLDGTYTYKGPETMGGKNLERIDATWTATFVPPKKAAGLPGLQFSKVDFKAESAKGTYWFDNGAGRLARMTRKLNSKGTLTVSAGGQELQLEADQEQSQEAKSMDKPGQ
jgi:hypothetical protein